MRGTVCARSGFGLWPMRLTHLAVPIHCLRPGDNGAVYRFSVLRIALLDLERRGFHRRSITVRAAYAKNGESRSVPMNEVLTTTLEEVRISSAATGPVFLNRPGIPYKSLRTAFKSAVLKTVIPDCTFHSLRHTFASCLAMSQLEQFGTKSHQFSQPGPQQGRGEQYKLLKNRMLP